MKELVLGVTAVDAHDLTAVTLAHTASNMSSDKVQLVVIDNASKKPYRFKGKGPVRVIRNKKNWGCYYPLKQLYHEYPWEDVIGIMHNDAAIFEKGWEEKILAMFKKDKKLGVVGLFGWQGIDAYGVDKWPIGNPKEEKGQPRGKYTRVTKLTPAVTLDSMCLFFRRDVIPLLRIDEDILLRHGFDKIWCMRLREKGYKVGVSGLSFQHKGMAAFQDPEYMATMKRWYDKRWNIDFPLDSVEGLMLLEGRILLMNEFKKKGMIPARV